MCHDLRCTFDWWGTSSQPHENCVFSDLFYTWRIFSWPTRPWIKPCSLTSVNCQMSNLCVCAFGASNNLMVTNNPPSLELALSVSGFSHHAERHQSNRPEGKGKGYKQPHSAGPGSKGPIAYLSAAASYHTHRKAMRCPKATAMAIACFHVSWPKVAHSTYRPVAIVVVTDGPVWLYSPTFYQVLYQIISNYFLLDCPSISVSA